MKKQSRHFHSTPVGSKFILAPFMKFSRLIQFLPALSLVLMNARLIHAAETPPDRADLTSLLEMQRARFKLPALAAAVVRGNQTIAIGATGFRRQGGVEKVTLEDKFHIGSCTKSMTGTLAAMMVEEGGIRWDQTVADVFPAMAPSMHPDFRGATLELLCANRGGAPNTLDADGLWGRLWRGNTRPPGEQRLELLRGVLTKPPAAKPGTTNIYSNAGVAIAGAMLETVAGKPWEDLIQEKLFRPLGMKSAGFGAPATVGQVNQPWGHIREGGQWKPIPPGPGADNPAAIGPAGTVHCSIGDLAKYVALHLDGENGRARLLKPESFKKLHTPPPGQDYALGWFVTRRPWGGGTVLNHNGSNTMFYTIIWIAPKKDFAFIVCTNVGGDEAAKDCDEVVGQLIQKFLPGR